MNCIIPFTKDIKFKTNIGEILSISLEHDYTVNNNEILGNFVITGDYKTHEVSINKESFEHVLPFSVDVANRIDVDSVDFTVEDFTYEIVDNDTLRVNIEYSVNALELPEEDLFEEDKDTPSLDDLIDEIDEVREDDKEEEEMVNEVMEQEEVEVEEERDIAEETKETILNSINDKDDVFVTYYIHVFKETDTIDTICMKYNTTQNILGEYNDLNTLAVGDKVIIPGIDE